MVAERVGDRVRRLRRARRWTQQQLAEAIGTDKSYIGRLEAGIIAEPGVDVQERIADALGVHIREVADPRFYKDEAPARDALSSIEATILSEPTLSDERKQAGLVVMRDLFARSKEQAS